MSYERKTVNITISYLLNNFPCVAVIGSRQTGKTTLLKTLFPDAPFYDLEERAAFERIQRDPDFFLAGFGAAGKTEKPLVIDEAQELASLFPALRVAIDQHRQRKGRFLISGSSSEALLKNITESLAGRIAIFELEGFSLEESRQLPPSELYEMIAKRKIKEAPALKKRLERKDLLDACLYGGYPEPSIQSSNSRFFALWMENYFRTYIDRDVRRHFPALNLENYRTFIKMLAQTSGQILNASDFARSIDVSQPTIKNYLRIAEGTFIWRTLPAFSKNVEKRVTKMPKGYLKDSGLLNFMLRNRSTEDLLNHPALGRIWESFISEELIKQFRNRLISVEPHYYRTHNKAEIDLVLEGDFGLLPIEIKFGTAVEKKRLIALSDFISEHQVPYGLVINNGDQIAWLAPQILQIPASFL